MRQHMCGSVCFWRSRHKKKQFARVKRGMGCESTLKLAFHTAKGHDFLTISNCTSSTNSASTIIRMSALPGAKQSRFRGIVLLVGYPGSGKGTQGSVLAKHLDVPHVSTGELFRAEVATGSDIGKQMDVFMRSGNIIPPQLTFTYLECEFIKPTYQNGFILDGYPKNLECLEWLLRTCSKWHNLEVSSAIEIYVSREEAKRRLMHRSTESHARSDDIPEAICARLTVYEEETMPLLQIYRCRGILSQVNGAQPVEVVTAAVRDAIEPRSERSYYVRSPTPGTELSSRFHSHLDGHNHALVLRMTKMIQERTPSVQAKIYPISYLQLGPQVHDVEFTSVYRSLPNFHAIENATDEAFMTGKMGDVGFDYEQIEATLRVAFDHPGSHVMTELEEELFQLDVDVIGRVHETWLQDPTSSGVELDWKRLTNGWREKQIAHVPQFELHHGFDVPRIASDTLPVIALASLMKHSVAAGLRVGGWFVFMKSDFWCYRCNEFANRGTSISHVMTLKKQASQLRAIVNSLLTPSDDKTHRRLFTSTASLERVHAMWCVQ